ncbi:MAG TPA: hypothetical protein VK284_04335 [Streptosporangiaceae bacterium]|nr:hypothetical protein [Streptosporangiaceae bacterium]
MADALTLASAQLAVAREYGFASRTRLRDEGTARMLAATPQARRLRLRHRGDPGRRRPRADRARPGSRPVYARFVWTRAKGATGRSAY